MKDILCENCSDSPKNINNFRWKPRFFFLFQNHYHSMLSVISRPPKFSNFELNQSNFSDCTHGTKTVKHLHKYAATNTAANLNNNSINVNNNQSARRQFSISEDGPTISEDDLDNLINQSINEWQQRQKSNGDDISIDSDIDQSTVILS